MNQTSHGVGILAVIGRSCSSTQGRGGSHGERRRVGKRQKKKSMQGPTTPHNQGGCGEKWEGLGPLKRTMPQKETLGGGSKGTGRT